MTSRRTALWPPAFLISRNLTKSGRMTLTPNMSDFHESRDPPDRFFWPSSHCYRLQARLLSRIEKSAPASTSTSPSGTVATSSLETFRQDFLDLAPQTNWFQNIAMNSLSNQLPPQVLGVTDGYGRFESAVINILCQLIEAQRRFDQMAGLQFLLAPASCGPGTSVCTGIPATVLPSLFPEHPHRFLVAGPPGPRLMTRTRSSYCPSEFFSRSTVR
jgi:hypothetical protein